MQINIDEINTQRIQLNGSSLTLSLIEDWYHDTKKDFLIIDEVLLCLYNGRRIHCNIVVGREDSSPTEDRGEKPRLTMSYLKRNIPFCYREDYCFSDYAPEKRHRFLLNAVHKTIPTILKAKHKDFVLFQYPVTLYAQSAWDRKKELLMVGVIMAQHKSTTARRLLNSLSKA